MWVLRDRVGLRSLGPLVFSTMLFFQAPLDPRSWWLPAMAATAGLLVVLGAQLLPRYLQAGRLLVTAGLACACFITAPRLAGDPVLAYALLLLVAGGSFALWDTPSRQRVSHERELAWTRVRTAAVSIVTLAIWLIAELASPFTRGFIRFALVVSILISMGQVTVWLRTAVSRGLGRVLVLAFGLSFVTSFLVLLTGRADLALRWAVVPIAVSLVAVLAGVFESITDVWGIVFHHPARLLIVTFLVLSAVGTAWLALPWSAAEPSGHSLIDAAFTAVSAVCVTGLIVLDTPNDFSGFGQLVILILIQLGGLGIMSLSTAALALLGRRWSMKYEGAVAALVSGSRSDLFGALRFTLLLTFVLELVGAALLYPSFRAAGDGPAASLWRAVFTAVSAFCNAGFALQTDSLVGYQAQPWVLHVVGFLIIAGGLSPAVIASLPTMARGRPAPLGAKIALAATAVLLLAGFVGFAALEWNGSLEGMSIGNRLHNAWFQSLTLRTAGFNSVPTAAVEPATLTLMMGLMYIGGSPGGTAGGIKTTTFVILVLAVAGAIRGRWRASAFGRSIPHSAVYRSTAISTLGIVSIIAGIVAIQLTQRMPGQVAVFEIVSAMGTVGLSLGGTTLLDEVGKLIIMASMFMGRVGPLTAFVFLYERRSPSPWELPQEDVQVG